MPYQAMVLSYIPFRSLFVAEILTSHWDWLANLNRQAGILAAAPSTAAMPTVPKPLRSILSEYAIKGHISLDVHTN
jgi:hypothetical protein